MHFGKKKKNDLETNMDLVVLLELCTCIKMSGFHSYWRQLHVILLCILSPVPQELSPFGAELCDTINVDPVSHLTLDSRRYY